MDEVRMDESKNDVITADFWNGLAKPCSHYERRSGYADEFIRLSGIMPGESVFDMGCGSGTLCLPLADDGHEVFCADFSEGMLGSVKDTVAAEGITLITTELLTWEEDWALRNLPVCDLAFASRSIFFKDLKDVFGKLSGVARRRVCITLPTGNCKFSPNLTAAGKYDVGTEGERDEYIETALATIRQLGYTPQLTLMGGNAHWAFIAWDLGKGQ